MRIPLHLKNLPWDSREDDMKRVELHTAMSMLNPKGFRQPGKRSAPTRIERIAASVFSD